MKRINVGLIGFGTIGTGVVKILNENAELIENRLGASICLKKVADLDISTDRGVKIDPSILTTNVNDILNNPEIDIVVELIGGCSPAKTYLLEAISNKKSVVTANKALLAEHGEEIFIEAGKQGVEIGFEASVAGGIPIIRVIREGLVANNIESIYGIINGTANYILTKMSDEGKNFSDVLKEARENGYAEADPSFDVEGIDTAHKLVILTRLSFGIKVSLKDIYTEGITHLTPLDIEYAKEFGYTIKLLAIAKKVDQQVEVRVHPTMLPSNHLMSMVKGVFNAIYIKGNAVGPIILYGQGAGALPTGSAVVSDIVEIGRNLIRENKIGTLPLMEKKEGDIHRKKIEETIFKYYIRFSTADKPGVLSTISGILGRHQISIASVIQKGRKEVGPVSIVMMTHEALERDILQALAEIDKLPIVSEKILLIRVEEGE